MTTTGPNWQVETDYHFVRWDDVIQTFSRRTIFWRVPLGIIAFLDFVVSGALWGYLRTNWHYAGFFLYPFVMFGALILAAVLVGVLALKASGSISVAIVAGFARARSASGWPLALAAPGCHFSTTGFFLATMFGRVIRSSSKDWTDWPRRSSQRLAAPDADELLVIGHSLGAVLAVDLLDRALMLDPALGARKVPVTFLTIGSSVLKIGLHRGATRFRAAVERVAGRLASSGVIIRLASTS